MIANLALLCALTVKRSMASEGQQTLQWLRGAVYQ